MDNELEIDIDSMDIDQLKEYLGPDIEEYVQPGLEVPTDTTTQPDQVQQPLRKDNNKNKNSYHLGKKVLPQDQEH